jgi:hypothetical protein
MKLLLNYDQTPKATRWIAFLEFFEGLFLDFFLFKKIFRMYVDIVVEVTHSYSLHYIYPEREV